MIPGIEMEAIVKKEDHHENRMRRIENISCLFFSMLLLLVVWLS